jgi:hypothetical protein
MIRAAAVAGAVLALVGHPHPRGSTAKAPPHTAAAPRPGVRPPPPMPMLPNVSRVRVEVARDHVVVHEEVSFPRGEWTGGGLDLHVAFGAPGTPIAVDAQIGAGSSTAADPRPDEHAEAATVEPAQGHFGAAQALLGNAHMAGVVVHVKEAQLKRAYAASEVALLRVRSLLAVPVADPSGKRDVVVRLGAPEGAPLTLGRIQVVSLEPKPWITRAEANLCGAQADPWPLSVSLVPRPAQPPSSPVVRPIAPSMAVRHPTDDLCIRWWATDGP